MAYSTMNDKCINKYCYLMVLNLTSKMMWKSNIGVHKGQKSTSHAFKIVTPIFTPVLRTPFAIC